MADDAADLIALTADITASFVANNRVGSGEIAGLISSIHGALAGLGQPAEPPKAERPDPAVPIKKSVQPDYLVDLFTGKRVKMLKRYLATNYKMSPADYRSYWGLPESYPMVAPNYAESRRVLAKAIGLGRKSGGKADEMVESDEPVIEAEAAAPEPAAEKPARKPRAKKAAAETAQEPAVEAPAKPARKPRAKKTAEA